MKPDGGPSLLGALQEKKALTPIPDLLTLLVSIPPAVAIGALWYTLLQRFSNRLQQKPSKGKEVKAAREPPLLLAETKTSISPNATTTTAAPPETNLRLPLDPLMARCACGLELSERSMLEHAQSTGHSGISAASPIRVGKIWDLQEAVIESASPSCFRCGRPVQGLRRVGKTIYVSHSGCQQRKQSETDKIAETPKTSPTHSVSGKPRRIVNCPICWKPLTGRRGITQVPSASGGRLKFHDQCLDHA